MTVSPTARWEMANECSISKQPFGVAYSCNPHGKSPLQP